MVVQSQSPPTTTITDQLIFPALTPAVCKVLPTLIIPTPKINERLINTTQMIPVIDLSIPNSKTDLIKACEDFGFFKVINGHNDVPFEFINNLENEAINFFSLPLNQKHKLAAAAPGSHPSSSSSPFGYGNKRIGQNGDVGWLEYLLLPSSPEFISNHSPQNFSCAVNNYLEATKKMACRVLEALAEGLKMDQNDAFSRMLKDDKSDSCFRINHYPPCPSSHQLTGGKLVGFGEHTDPQIISVLRSNDACGFEISIGHGNWLPVPSDPKSFFVIVGDSLQVMSNGRFKSVKHRVMAEGNRSRISMIYFGAPPPGEKIAPLRRLMGEGEESKYKEFTWSEYKKAANKTRLADYRLGQFEKRSPFPNLSINL